MTTTTDQPDDVPARPVAGGPDEDGTRSPSAAQRVRLPPPPPPPPRRDGDPPLPRTVGAAVRPPVPPPPSPDNVALIERLLPRPAEPPMIDLREAPMPPRSPGAPGAPGAVAPTDLGAVRAVTPPPGPPAPTLTPPPPAPVAVPAVPPVPVPPVAAVPVLPVPPIVAVPVPSAPAAAAPVAVPAVRPAGAAAVAGGGEAVPDRHGLVRRVLGELGSSTVEDHRQVERAVAALTPAALERLGEDVTPPGAGVADASLGAAVVEALLVGDEPGEAAALAEVVALDHAERLGPADRRVVRIVELLVAAHQRLDERALDDMLARNTLLLASARKSLGADHAVALAAAHAVDRLRAAAARRRTLGPHRRA